MKSCNLTKNKFYTDYIKEYTNYKNYVNIMFKP